MKTFNPDKARDQDPHTQPRADRRRNALCLLAFAAAAIVVTLAAYQPAWQGGLLWDDDKHITAVELRSVEGLRRIWFELGATQQYYPLLHSAFWLQHRIWADQTLGYHLVNIVLHALSAVLVVLILRRLRIPGAFLAGAIFALHPVHVESVAWITELKNTLSGALYLTAALAYIRFDDDRRKRNYFAALGLFVLALASKTVTGTLPAALLVVFWWKRGRLSWRRDVLPLAPFFVLGVSAGLFTAWVERVYIGALGTDFHFTFAERCILAGRAIWFYLGKLFWPAHLAFNYPRWEISQAVSWQYLYPLGVVGLMAVLWAYRKRTRAPLAAMLFYCGTLFPTLGFFNVYPFKYSFVADHFQYLASLGVIALVSAGVARLLRRFALWPGPAAFVTVLLLAVVLGVRTWQQSRNYTDIVTLYRATLDENPESWMAHNNLGVYLEAIGRHEEAIAHFREALRIKERHPEAHNNLGGSLMSVGDHQEAVVHFQKALRIKPNYADPHNNLGAYLQSIGRPREAIVHFQEALRIKPDYAEAYYNLGVSLQVLGELEQAIPLYRHAVSIKPDFIDAHYNLGVALQSLGRHEEAISPYRQALRLRPAYAEAYHNLGAALQALGRPREAIPLYEQALKIKPNSADAHANLAAALWLLGRREEAINHHQESLRLKSGGAAARGGKP